MLSGLTLHCPGCVLSCVNLLLPRAFLGLLLRADWGMLEEASQNSLIGLQMWQCGYTLSIDKK